MYQSNIWRHDQTHRRSIFTALSYFADSVIFAVAAFFSSSGFVISFPCFPAFFHCGRIESVGLWAAIFMEDVFQTSPRFRCCGSWGRNSIVCSSCGGSTKPVHYIIINQSGTYNFQISRVPAFYLPNMAFKSFHWFPFPVVMAEKNTGLVVVLFAFNLWSQRPEF